MTRKNTVDGRQQSNNESTTIRTQLNKIAHKGKSDDRLPAMTTHDEVETLCNQLSDEIADHTAKIKERTTFSDEKAEAWGLVHTTDSDGVRMTSDAIALYLSVVGDSDEWITPETVESWVTEMKGMVNHAKEIVGTMTFPHRNEVLTNPQIVWVSSSTLRDVSQVAPDEVETTDDVLQLFIEDYKEVIDLNELVTSYLDARGREAVAQLSVESSSLHTDELVFISHTGYTHQPLPSVVSDADAVRISDEDGDNDEVYDFVFREDPYGPSDLCRLTLYAADNIKGMDGLDVEQGIADLQMAITEQTISIDELVARAESRLNARAVTGTVASDGRIRLSILREGVKQRPTDRFRHVESLEVGDKQRKVTINERTVDLGCDPDDGIVVWRADTADSEAVALAAGIDQLHVAMSNSGTE